MPSLILPVSCEENELVVLLCVLGVCMCSCLCSVCLPRGTMG